MQVFLKINKEKIILLLIAALGLFFRLYGINWDQGFHLHPDERAIVMFTTPLNFPSSIQQFLSESSPWNPHFFAYGNFPLYLLKGIASIFADFDPLYLSYQKINLVGRAISAITDLGTLIVLFLLSKKLFNQKVGLLSSFFYSISVFPIQASHFYAVDSLLTFFIILTLYQLIRFYENPSFKNSLFTGVFFGLSLVTKISAIPLIISVVFAIASDFILIVIKQPHKPNAWLPHVPRFLKRLFLDGVGISTFTFITFIILQPYALIDFDEFLKQNILQSQMTHNAFIFPYTLQYVNKIPYFYEIKNVFLFGLGPILAIISFAGVLFFILHLFQKTKNGTAAKEIIIFVFFVTYFLVVGRFAVGWMRYMLPMYPLFALFAAGFTIKIIAPKLKVLIKNKFILNTLYLILYTSILIWPISFMHIYTKDNTRVAASDWINQNISYGQTLAIEHWDDSLPLYGAEKYKIITLELYNPDSQFKWNMISQQLSQTDYIIIASNRLYVPLMKLIDCQKLYPHPCYTQTNEYYKKLFNGDLGFKKIAEFTSYPKIPIFNIPINDESADESFTVYDHPKVMIFEKKLD